MNGEGSLFHLEKILAHLFFLLFTAQIFSPFYSGRTIYLELFVAILNPYFIQWAKQHINVNKMILFFMGCLFIICMGHPETVLKFSMIIVGVGYLYYANERKLFFLYYYLMLSIALAIFQFAFIFIDMDIAHMIGPENITAIIWGEYATPANTNFYTIFFISRVSGLSREAGFFASLLVSAIFLYYFHGAHGDKSSRLGRWMIFVGYILSFSKISLVVFPVMVFIRFKKFINAIPVWIGIASFVIGMVTFWYYNMEIVLQEGNATFFHRFAAYLLFDDIDVKSIFFGIDSTDKIGTYLSKMAVYLGFEEMAGLGGFILHNGILATGMCFVVLYYMGLTTTGFIVLFLLTINVQLDTNQNFVVLSYYIIFKYFSINRKMIFMRYIGG